MRWLGRVPSPHVETVRLKDVWSTTLSSVDARQSTSRSSGPLNMSAGMHEPLRRTKKGSLPGWRSQSNTNGVRHHAER